MKKLKKRDKYLLTKIFANILRHIHRIHTYITILYDKDTADKLILNLAEKIKDNLTKGGQHDKNRHNNQICITRN